MRNRFRNMGEDFRNRIRMVYASMSLAVAIILPFVTGQIPEIGQMLCPMHIPVLLCGFLCGWSWGAAVGFIAPLLRSVLFGMPAMFPNAVAMAFELAVYGFVTGLLRRKMSGSYGWVGLILVIAMIAGRLVWGTVRLVLLGLFGTPFSWALFLSGAVLNALPGIILQLLLIPGLVIAMEAAGISLNQN